MVPKINMISGLRDWSPDYDKLIPKGTAAAKSMIGVVAKEMGLYIDEKGHYHTSGYVGVGWLKDYQGKIVVSSKNGMKTAIKIEPRFSMDPWEMLVKVLNDPEYELYTSGMEDSFFEIYTGEELIPVPNTESGGELLAALSFVKECEGICKNHLRQAMAFKEENFNGKVVGNIQVSKHIKKNISQAREDRIFCRYPVFTVDTLENRILKSALAKARNIFRNNGIRAREIGNMYKYCENALKVVHSTGVTKSDFSKINTSGFNSHYKPVMELAKVILFGKGVNDLVGKEMEDAKYIIPYTINMESLFEFYIRALIKDYLKRDPDSDIRLDDYRMSQKNPLQTLKEADKKAYLMNKYVPDIALLKGDGKKERYIAVFDVKYQNSRNSVYAESRRHNSHQLLFYTLLLNVRKCGFIFPMQNTDDESGHIDLYALNIQTGDAMDSSEREYTQWTSGNNSGSDNRLVERIMEYVKRDSDNLKTERGEDNA